MDKEKKGELWIFGETMIFAAFPIITSYATRLIPPIFFAGISTFIAGLTMLVYLAVTRQLKHLLNVPAMKYMMGAVLFIAFLPQIFIFYGASKTSAINISILWEMEIVFTLIFCGIWYGERITKGKILGAMLIILGATAILYRDNFTLNLGDIFIIVGVAIFPFGNMATKEALKLVPGPVVLCVRSILGGLMLFAVSAVFENYAMPPVKYLSDFLWIFLINGIVALGLAKLMWYKGLKYMDIGKAIPISQSAPALTLLYLLLFFGEIPELYQWAGLALVMAGLFIFTRPILRAI